MLVIAVMNGWSASSRGKHTRTSALVERLTRDQKRVMLHRKALLFASRARMFRRFIKKHESGRNRLLLVGKSLGARNLVVHVLNKFEAPLMYKRSALVTIDANWPVGFDLRPNLNKTVLELENEIDLVLNYVAILPACQQAGALIRGENVFNDMVPDADHFSITKSAEVEFGIKSAIAFLGQ